MRIYIDDTHQVAEGAGAAPPAAFLQEHPRSANQNVGLILTGGNIERARLLQVLEGATPPAAPLSRD
jgi:threonine dehydratase